MGTTQTGPIESLKGTFAHRTYQLEDDFIGAGNVIPAAGSAESGIPWVQGITGAAPPTLAAGADAAGGVLIHTLTSASQAQDAALYTNDQRNFNVLKPGFCIGILKVTTLPTLLSKIVFGLAADRNANPDSITESIWVAITTDGIFAEKDDASTDQSVDSGIDIVANDVVAIKIDWTVISAVKYYIAVNPTQGKRVNWSRIASGTQFNFAATGANAVLQPYVTIAKASGAGLGVFQTDYVYFNGTR